jgi:hypothetical protein
MEQQKIIKRLELIKGLISLEEEEEILLHIVKLQTLQLNDNVKNIILQLKNKEYNNALIAIEKFINQYQGIVRYSDRELEALRFEAKTIELQIQQLSAEKAELEKLVHEFGVRHNQELGELILKILKYRKEKLKDTPLEGESKKDYEDFFKDYEATKEKKIATLTEEEKKELKDKYRKASKLCHPDVVAEEYKKEAHKIFSELNSAYERNDLKRVSEILENLEQGKIFKSKSDSANEKNSLKSEIMRLRSRLNEIIDEITKIKLSETFLNIVSIEDWDSHFSQTKKKLQQQLNELENGK